MCISCKWGQDPQRTCFEYACSSQLLYLGLSLCLSGLLSSPTLTLYTTFCAFESERSLGIVHRNSLVFYHHGLLDIWFILFGIRNKIVLPFSVQLHRQGFIFLIFFFLFLQGSKLKARRRTSRSPRLAAWKSSGWSIRESAILRAAQIFPEIAG